MATEGQFFLAKDEIETKVIEVAKKYNLDSYQLIRILALMTNEVASQARNIEKISE